MTSGAGEMRDMVHVHVTADLPIRARALSFADRIEVRFGNAFPVAMVIDRLALDRLEEAIEVARGELDRAGLDTKRKGASS